MKEKEGHKMPTTKNGSKRKGTLEKSLISLRDDLRIRIHGRLNEVYIDRGPDDEAALATESVTTDMTVATLERERRTLEEVESALERLKNGSYGSCAFCGETISEARLAALPWARLCIQCAGRASNSVAAD
jgi:RNA polymerase-binding protein DksA